MASTMMERRPLIQLTIPAQATVGPSNAQAPLASSAEPNCRELRAVSLLLAALQHGPATVRELRNRAQLQRLCRRDLRLARLELGVKSYLDEAGQQVWELPSTGTG